MVILAPTRRVWGPTFKNPWGPGDHVNARPAQDASRALMSDQDPSALSQVAIPGAVSPFPEAQAPRLPSVNDESERRWMGQMILEIERLREEKAKCGGRSREKEWCLEAAERALLAVEGALSRQASGLTKTESSLKQRHETETRALLVGLQYLAARLKVKGNIKYELFIPQMDAFKRDLQEPARSKAALEARPESQKGRDVLAMERASQWETARRLIEEASAIARSQ